MARAVGTQSGCGNAHRHIFVARASQLVCLQLAAAVLASLAVAEAGRSFGLVSDAVQLPAVLGSGQIRLTLFPLLVLVLGLRPLMLRRDAVFEIGCHHLRGETGRISLRRHSIEVPFEDIRGVRVSQTLFQRLIGVGDVILWTAFSELPEVSLRSISGPHRIAREISHRLDEARQRGRSDVHREPRLAHPAGSTR